MIIGEEAFEGPTTEETLTSSFAMASAVAVDDPPLPEPPDPPDPLMPSSSFAQTSITKPSFLFPLFPSFPSSYPDLHMRSPVSSFVSSSDTLFACLRPITAMCRFRNQICSQICLLPIDFLAKSVGYGVSSLLLTSAEYGPSLPTSHHLLLARSFLTVGSLFFDSSPSVGWVVSCEARLSLIVVMSPSVGAAACFFFETSTSLPLPIPLVHSCSMRFDSSTLGSHQISVEFVAMVLWNAGLDLLFPKDLVTFGCRFVLSCGTLIAFMRSFTAVCRFLSHITMSMLLITFSTLLWQFGQRATFICNRLVILVLLGFHNPHFSFKELIILPNTSLVFSDIITGSILLQVVNIYGFVDVKWEVQSLFRASLPHLGTCCQFLFPKFPLVWSGLDDQVSPVLQGSSSRLTVYSALVAELVALWVALDAVTHEAFVIVFFRSLLVFFVELYFQSISSLTFFRWTLKLFLLCYLVLSSHLDVIPPLLIEFEA